MKNAIRIAIALLSVAISLSSCASLGGDAKEKPVPANVLKALSSANTLAVLGYNTSTGLDDRHLDNAIKQPLLDIKLEFVDARGVKFPIGGRVDSYEQDFLSKLKIPSKKFLDKSKVLSSAEYKKIKGDPVAELNNVNAAQGYALTYQFDNWMDDVNGSWIPARGNIVNAYKGTLEDIGADLGIIVVQKPYVAVHTYSLIPDQLFFKKQSYFTVASRAYYFIVRPSLGNQILYAKEIFTASDTKYLLKGYTSEQRKVDEVTFLDQFDTITKKSHDEFVAWLAQACE